MSKAMPTLPGLQSELKPGEPVFVLRAQDSLAPHMVAIWAALRNGDMFEAMDAFAKVCTGPMPNYIGIDSTDKVVSAIEKAVEMQAWRADNKLPNCSLGIAIA